MRTGTLCLHLHDALFMVVVEFLHSDGTAAIISNQTPIAGWPGRATCYILSSSYKQLTISTDPTSDLMIVGNGCYIYCTFYNILYICMSIMSGRQRVTIMPCLCAELPGYNTELYCCVSVVLFWLLVGCEYNNSKVYSPKRKPCILL